MFELLGIVFGGVTAVNDRPGMCASMRRTATAAAAREAKDFARHD